jgi:hypothetical protein
MVSQSTIAIPQALLSRTCLRDSLAQPNASSGPDLNLSGRLVANITLNQLILHRILAIHIMANSSDIISDFIMHSTAAIPGIQPRLSIQCPAQKHAASSAWASQLFRPQPQGLDMEEPNPIAPHERIISSLSSCQVQKTMVDYREILIPIMGIFMVNVE